MTPVLITPRGNSKTSRYYLSQVSSLIYLQPSLKEEREEEDKKSSVFKLASYSQSLPRLRYKKNVKISVLKY